MVDFTFASRTNLIFGEKKIEKLKTYLPNNARVLFLYGGGSIKSNGIYERTKAALEGLHFVEFSGIEPNPHYDTCIRAAEVIKKEKLNFVLAVGGGSVMDASKFIALAAKYEGNDAWEDIMNKRVHIVPVELGVIATLPATGSEMNNGFVISNIELSKKQGCGSPYTVPMFAICEPSCTLTLDQRQTTNGIADSFVHVTEQYLVGREGTYLQDRWAEGVLLSLINDSAPALMKNLGDLEARRSLMFAATMALNGYIGMGVGVMDWATHMIGHELTILYGVDHGQTLTAVLPSLLRVQFDIKKEKLAVYGKNVFGLSGSEDEVAKKAIEATEEFFRFIKSPVRISECAAIAADAPEVVSRRFAERGALLGEKGSINAAKVKEILLLAQK
ncbi:MAG: iron-containing alcohol dehydrogenase [Spirochaetaceae bacterium]|nr:iron-containing alcohol dehydrogenase [Spirochaetaceae bacterium]